MRSLSVGSPSPPIHPQADEILAKLRRENIDNLFHFTAVSNLPLIRHLGGLCSKERLENAKCWASVEPNADDLSLRLDSQLGNWNKVALNLTPHTPFAWKRKLTSHICYILVDPSVAAWQGVEFARLNAARTQEPHRDYGLRGVSSFDFEAIRSAPHERGTPGYDTVQAEILVPDKISVKYFRSIAFISEASRLEAQRAWGDAPHPPFLVRPHLFDVLASKSPPRLPNLADLRITAVSLKGGQRWDPTREQLVIRRGEVKWLNVGARVYTPEEKKACARLARSGREYVCQLKEGQYTDHYVRVEVSDLFAEDRFEYYIGDAKWATVAITVTD